jgi:outer membrane protein TolC
MRGTIVILGLALAMAVTAGCKQPIFMTEGDYDHYRAMPDMPPNIDSDPNVGSQPGKVAIVPTPMSVLDVDRKQRFISLQECIAIALEQGTDATSVGQIRDGTFFNGINFNPSPLTDSVRVLALEPAIAEPEIDHALSRFDARWVSGMTWSFTDVPFGGSTFSFLRSASAQSGTNQYRATPFTGVIQPLPTGGTAGITFTVPYTDFNPSFGRLNPAYSPVLHFGFEQPLLQGFGVEINQLRQTHPGALLDQNLQTGAGNIIQRNGIILARIRFDQNRANFEANVQNLVANVETAYWNLYNAYAQLYANEQGLIQTLAAWRINEAKLRAGTQRVADVAQSRGQYELFRANRMQSLGQVLEAERQLRGFLSLPMEDGSRLVPSDKPTVAPYIPDWNVAQQEAFTLKPELVLAREQLKVRQLELILQRNSLLPDLRFGAQYEINALGQSLDGAGTENAFRNLATNRFNNWTLQLLANVPIGNRAAYADVRIARLNLAQSYYTLRDAEDRTTRFLTLQYRQLLQQYELIKINRSQREAFAEQLRARFLLFQAQTREGGTLDVLLEAQRFWATALGQEAQAITNYNIALANFELAKGTILQHNNITIGEGPLPAAAAVRAVDHLREKNAALVALERPVPQVPVVPNGPSLVLPQFTPGMAPSLPSLFPGGPQLNLNRPDLLPPSGQGPTLPQGIEPQNGTPTTLPQTGTVPAKPTPVGSLAPRMPPVATVGMESTGTASQTLPGNVTPGDWVSTEMAPAEPDRTSKPRMETNPSDPTPAATTLTGLQSANAPLPVPWPDGQPAAKPDGRPSAVTPPTGPKAVPSTPGRGAPNPQLSHDDNSLPRP